MMSSSTSEGSSLYDEDFFDPKNESRMTSLFAPFRDRSLNPEGWESKFSFWSAMIQKYCERNNCFTFTLHDLNKDFRWNGRLPECLPTVVEELQRNNTIVQPSNFCEKYQVPNSLQAWLRTGIWIFSSFFFKHTYFESSISSNTQFIHLSALQKICDEIFAAAKDEIRGLVPMESLLSTCSVPKSFQTDALYIAYYMRYKDLLDIAAQDRHPEWGSRIIVKLRTSSMKRRPCITKVDEDIFTLSCNEEKLVQYLDKLEREKQHAIDKAKHHVKTGNTLMAKMELRKKMELQRIIEKRSHALTNIQTLLARIRDAESDCEVLEAYKVGVTALKDIFRSAGLTEDYVVNVMDELKETIDTQGEIESLMGSLDLNTCNEDVEEELAELERNQHETNSASGGNPDNDLQDRLRKLRLNDNISQPCQEDIGTLPTTPMAVSLVDLPDAPTHTALTGTLTPL